MKNCIFSVLFLMVILSPIISAQQQESNPTLVFYVDYENQQKKDFVQITLQIESKDTSLTKAINSAALTVEQISALAKQFCNQNSKKKGQCKDIVDAGKFDIEPRYQVIRKEPVFMGFTVTHQMTIAVKSVDNIGYLVDKILTKPGITLQNFEWKAEQEPKTHEQAIAEGLQEGKGLCEQLGLKMGRIISIQQENIKEIEDEQTSEQQQKGEEEDEEEEEAEQTVFRFQVECEQAQDEEDDENEDENQE